VNEEKSVLQVVWVGSTARLLKDTIKEVVLKDKFVVKDVSFEPEEIIAKGAYYYALGLEQNWKYCVQNAQTFQNICVKLEDMPNNFCDCCSKFVNTKMKDENASKEEEKQALLMKQWVWNELRKPNLPEDKLELETLKGEYSCYSPSDWISKTNNLRDKLNYKKQHPDG